MGAEQRAKAISDVRNSLLQGLGGGVLLLGAFFTWRQLQVTREGQITDRFIKAIEQLASEETDAQIGAIYALGRIAKDSTEDQEAIVEILTAYVRQRSPRGGDSQTIPGNDPEGALPKRAGGADDPRHTDSCT
jgi:hypothetical protein